MKKAVLMAGSALRALVAEQAPSASFPTEIAEGESLSMADQCMLGGVRALAHKEIESNMVEIDELRGRLADLRARNKDLRADSDFNGLAAKFGCTRADVKHYLVN